MADRFIEVRLSTGSKGKDQWIKQRDREREELRSVMRSRVVHPCTRAWVEENFDAIWSTPRIGPRVIHVFTRHWPALMSMSLEEIRETPRMVFLCTPGLGRKSFGLLMKHLGHDGR